MKVMDFGAPRIFHRFRQIRKVATGEARHQRRKRSIHLSPICDANVAEYPSNPLILLLSGPGRTRTSNQAVMSQWSGIARPYAKSYGISIE